MEKLSNTKTLHLVKSTTKDAALAELASLPPDWGESFLAEMETRRERLQYWLRLIREAAAEDMRANLRPARQPAHRCRGSAPGGGHAAGGRRCPRFAR